MIDLLDTALMAGAALAGAGLAFFTPTLKRAVLLFPLNPARPREARSGGNIVFRFRTYGDIRDRTTYRPRVLLALILFGVLAALLKLIVNPETAWTTVYYGVLGILGVGLLVVSRLVNTLAIAVMLVVPLLIVNWMDLTDPRWWGVAAGVLVGSFGGIYIARNYRTLIHRNKLELSHGQTFDGRPLGGFGRWYRKIYVVVLQFVPLVVAYQLVVFWWPAIDLSNVAAGMSAGSPGKFALIGIAIALGFNLVFFMIPLFREMLEKANREVAAEFTTAVNKAEAEAEAKSEEPEKPKYDDPADDPDRPEAFLTKKGRWVAFHPNQMLYIAIVTIVLLVNGLGQVIIKALGAGVDLGPLTESGYTLKNSSLILSGITFCANVLFLLCLIPLWLPDEGDIDAMEENAKVRWQWERDASIVVTCREIEEDSDPIIEVVQDEHITSPPIAKAPEGGES